MIWLRSAFLLANRSPHSPRLSLRGQFHGWRSWRARSSRSSSFGACPGGGTATVSLAALTSRTSKRCSCSLTSSENILPVSTSSSPKMVLEFS
eukprot:3251003-Pyramimonas_sp.AAC.1